MSWLDIAKELLGALVVPFLGVVTGCIVKIVHEKSLALKNKITNENLKKYIEMLDNTIEECVVATNQTYVENLKKKNLFDTEAQIDALEKTRQAVEEIISEECKIYLSTFYGDLEKVINEKIEREVNFQKGVN